MKNNFRGWTSVYAFTLRQSTKGAGFKMVTLLISLLLLGGFILVNVMVAKPDKKAEIQSSPIKKVYVLDNSGLNPANYKEIISHISAKEFGHVEFETVTDKSEDEVVKLAGGSSSESLGVIISVKDSGYEMRATIPKGSELTDDDASALLGPMSSAFHSNKLMQAGLSTEQLEKVLKPSVVSFSEIGESTNEVAKIIKMVAPMVFSFVLYFMLILYGQNVSKSVSTEKTSKLMETLLTSVHPYAMIAGKVLAVTSIALGQFVAWIGASFAGLYGGNAIARSIYPEYENSVITIISFLKDNIGETAFTIPAVILAVVIFYFGFLFYSTIAALAGCMVSRPEDVASTQALFHFPIIISWLVSYLGPIMGGGAAMKVTRYIPFTSPFSVPVELITGSIGLIEGAISLGILMVFSLFTVILSARIYKGFVLYSGQNFSFKMIGNVLKGKG